jgi:hypothetical protein
MTSEAFPEPAAFADLASEPFGAPGPDTLRQAMRRARMENAERAGILADLHAARLARLDLLKDALGPLVAQIPPGIDFFDIAVLPGEPPRLFIDMIGFVEMGRDARQYRLLQDSRYGRHELAASESAETMVGAITDYVARRLLERDKALASTAIRPADPILRTGRLPACFTTPPPERTGEEATASGAEAPGPVTFPAARPGVAGWAGLLCGLLVDLVGSAVLLAALVGLGFYAWGQLVQPSS